MMLGRREIIQSILGETIRKIRNCTIPMIRIRRITIAEGEVGEGGAVGGVIQITWKEKILGCITLISIRTTRKSKQWTLL